VKSTEYPNCKQIQNYMYQKLKVKVWNYLAKHQNKLATHKCVTTPWLRTTDLDYVLRFMFYFQINKLEGKALEDRWEMIKIHLSDLMIMVQSAAKFLAPVDQI
jgi:hypothetical protein